MTKKILAPVLFCFLFLGSCAVHKEVPAAGTDAKAGTQANAQEQAKKVLPVFVGYQIPERKDFKVSLSFTAAIVPILQADIRPKTAGWLTGVNVNTGEEVRQGEMVAEMDHVQLDQAISEAKAELASANDNYQSLVSGYESSKANVQKQAAIVENDELTVKRDKDLLNQGFLPQQQYDNARTIYLSDKASLESLKSQMLAAKSQLSSQKAQIERVQAGLAIAEANLSDAFLKAPFSGSVTIRNLDPGAYVGTVPGFSSPSIMTIADLKKLKAMVDVADRDVPKVHVGQKAVLSVDAYPGRFFPGSVTRIAGLLDPASRTLTVEIDISNPDRLLVPGMFAHVSIITSMHPDAIVLPLHAVVKEGDKSFVWVLDVLGKTADGNRLQVKARKISVATGAIEGSHIEILSGLKGDELVVTDGIELIHPGAQLEAPLQAGSSNTTPKESYSSNQEAQ